MNNFLFILFALQTATCFFLPGVQVHPPTPPPKDDNLKLSGKQFEIANEVLLKLHDAEDKIKYARQQLFRLVPVSYVNPRRIAVLMKELNEEMEKNRQFIESHMNSN